MCKFKKLTILFILCFLALNGNIYAADITTSESTETLEAITETATESKAEEAVTDVVKTDAVSDGDDEEEKSSSDESEESSVEEDEDEEPDCD